MRRAPVEGRRQPRSELLVDELDQFSEGRGLDPDGRAWPATGAVPARVSRWKNALLDLSLRNRRINYTERSGYRIEIPGGALPRLEDQISAEAPLTLVASDAVAGIDVARGT
ncbi:MAG: hypothetical protein HHJ10_13940 [Cellulomonas sp.]|nr:hypothetical protein [Cellulomonas sp.]